MSLPSDAELERIVASGRLSGAFFLFGEAARLRDQAAERLVDAAVDPAARDFNLDVYRGGDVEPETLAAALAMPPMMATRRVVMLSEAERLTPTGREVVLAAVETPRDDLAFVVTATIPSGSKAAFYRELKKRCRSLEWKTPREEELPGWALERAREAHGFELTADAAQALAAAVGRDLSVLDAELAKLAVAAGSEPVTRERVRKLVPHTRSVDRWEWLDLVASRRYEEALARLPELSAGESAVGLLVGMVDQHVLIGLALEGGTGRVRETLGETGRGYLMWKARVYAGQARAWHPAQLRRALRLMLRADRAAKSGVDDPAVLQELLLSLRLLAKRAA